MQDSIRKVREVVEWDLGNMCGTAEEIDMVHEAKDAMNDVESLFHVPKTKFWAEFTGTDMSESLRQAEEHNAQALPSEAMGFSTTDLDKLRADLAAIDEVLAWDIGANDDAEIATLREARESLEALKGIL